MNLATAGAVSRLGAPHGRSTRREAGPTAARVGFVALLVLASALVLGGCASAAPGGTATQLPKVDPTSGLPYVALADLPPEAAETVALIDAGGPFPYEKDGATFGNREGLLPDRPNGYYREYTVETPGSPDRGARRIVAGEDGELYWTDDHYDSFEVAVR